jgi:hypothetical protein
MSIKAVQKVDYRLASWHRRLDWVAPITAVHKAIEARPARLHRGKLTAES